MDPRKGNMGRRGEKRAGIGDERKGKTGEKRKGRQSKRKCFGLKPP